MPYRAGGTQVLERAAAWAHGRQNVLLLRGRWQDVLEKEVRTQLGESFAFDGVFFDTYEETVEGLLPLLPRILRPGGPSAHPPVGLGRGSPVPNAQLAAPVRRGALLSSRPPSLGRFSYCNVYQPQRPVRNVAFSAYLATRLAALGFRAAFCPIPFAPPLPHPPPGLTQGQELRPSG
jgi:hypothetical protein